MVEQKIFQETTEKRGLIFVKELAAAMLLLFAFIQLVYPGLTVFISIIDTLPYLNDPLRRGELYQDASQAIRENYPPAVAELLIDALNRFDEGKNINLDELLISVGGGSLGIDVSEQISAIRHDWEQQDLATQLTAKMAPRFQEVSESFTQRSIDLTTQQQEIATLSGEKSESDVNTDTLLGTVNYFGVTDPQLRLEITKDLRPLVAGSSDKGTDPHWLTYLTDFENQLKPYSFSESMITALFIHYQPSSELLRQAAELDQRMTRGELSFTFEELRAFLQLIARHESSSTALDDSLNSLTLFEQTVLEATGQQPRKIDLLKALTSEQDPLKSYSWNEYLTQNQQYFLGNKSFPGLVIGAVYFLTNLSFEEIEPTYYFYREQLDEIQIWQGSQATVEHFLQLKTIEAFQIDLPIPRVLATELLIALQLPENNLLRAKASSASQLRLSNEQAQTYFDDFLALPSDTFETVEESATFAAVAFQAFRSRGVAMTTELSEVIAFADVQARIIGPIYHQTLKKLEQQGIQLTLNQKQQLMSELIEAYLLADVLTDVHQLVEAFPGTARLDGETFNGVIMELDPASMQLTEPINPAEPPAPNRILFVGPWSYFESSDPTAVRGFIEPAAQWNSQTHSFELLSPHFDLRDPANQEKVFIAYSRTGKLITGPFNEYFSPDASDPTAAFFQAMAENEVEAFFVQNLFYNATLENPLIGYNGHDNMSQFLTTYTVFSRDSAGQTHLHLVAVKSKDNDVIGKEFGQDYMVDAHDLFDQIAKVVPGEIFYIFMGDPGHSIVGTDPEGEKHELLGKGETNPNRISFLYLAPTTVDSTGRTVWPSP